MRRQTHLAVGAFCAVPIASDLAPTAAVGALVCCLAGAVVPDYLDLRSDFKRVLRHRGMSHSVVVGVLATFVVYLIVDALSRVEPGAFSLTESVVQPMWLAFAVGLISHLALDACTPSGIQPALPLFRWRLWLLPRSMRIRTGGKADGMIRWLAAVAAMVLLVESLISGL